jgi:hypothetical protein
MTRLLKVAEWSPEHGPVLFGDQRRKYEQRRRRAAYMIRLTALAIIVALIGIVSYAVGFSELTVLPGCALLIIPVMIWYDEGDKHGR